MLFKRHPRRVQRLRGPAEIARDQRNLGLGNNTPRTSHSFFRAEGARGTSQENFRSNEVAKPRHRNASKRKCWRIVAQSDQIQCGNRITRRECTRREHDQWVHLNRVILVTHAVQCATLSYLTTTNQQVVSRKETSDEGAKGTERTNQND